MDASVGESGEEEASELLDETQRLRHKRDLLTRENEQLKSYLRLRQMESTATCEQLKSEIEQQIEQFEALGDNQTNHLETLKSFRSEIEAIQCWNAKIRNKYFSRNSEPNIADQLTDELIDEMVSAGCSGVAVDAVAAVAADQQQSIACDNSSDCIEGQKREKKAKKAIECKTNLKISNKSNYNIITRSKQKIKTKRSSDYKRKQLEEKTDPKARRMSKRLKN